MVLFRDTHENQGYFCGFIWKLILNIHKMRNKTNPTAAVKTATISEKVVVAFQDFNGVILAKISNLKNRETYAYGETEAKAEKNALRNYQLKYQSLSI